MLFNPADPLSGAFRQEIELLLDGFLGDLCPFDETEDLYQIGRRLVSGGKRVRPAFCVWGYLSAAPEPADRAQLMRVAASLDLLHASALVHDDVMDGSATRRGGPSAHVQLAALHRERGLHGDPDAFGRAGAILLGNLLLGWAAELTVGLRWRADANLAGLQMRVNTGQYLDVLAQARDPREARRDPDGMMELVRQVVKEKTSEYTVIYPLQIGAVLAGSPLRHSDFFTAFGTNLGRAFQYRDDLLGVFGDADVTGKPAGDDLREGKLTALIVHAMRLADDAGAERLASLLGKPDLGPDETDEARAIIRDCGAQAAVEDDIAAARENALAALDRSRIRPEAREALSLLALLLTDRVA